MEKKEELKHYRLQLLLPDYERNAKTIAITVLLLFLSFIVVMRIVRSTNRIEKHSRSLLISKLLNQLLLWGVSDIFLVLRIVRLPSDFTIQKTEQCKGN